MLAHGLYGHIESCFVFMLWYLIWNRCSSF